MGADGDIHIWKRSDVLKVWPDADKLAKHLNNFYCDKLGKVKYYHGYIDSEGGKDFDEDVGYWVKDETQKQRLKEFVAWLNDQPHTCWEVWT